MWCGGVEDVVYQVCLLLDRAQPPRPSHYFCIAPTRAARTRSGGKLLAANLQSFRGAYIICEQKVPLDTICHYVLTS